MAAGEELSKVVKPEQAEFTATHIGGDGEVVFSFPIISTSDYGEPTITAAEQSMALRGILAMKNTMLPPGAQGMSDKNSSVVYRRP